MRGREEQRLLSEHWTPLNVTHWTFKLDFTLGQSLLGDQSVAKSHFTFIQVTVVKRKVNIENVFFFSGP